MVHRIRYAHTSATSYNSLLRNSKIRIAGQLRLETNYYPETLEALLRSRIDGGDVIPTTAFLTVLLQIRPQDRGRARDLINHPWFTA
jgi:hypothetical protein